MFDRRRHVSNICCKYVRYLRASNNTEPMDGTRITEDKRKASRLDSQYKCIEGVKIPTSECIIKDLQLLMRMYHPEIMSLSQATLCLIEWLRLMQMEICT